MIRRLFPRKEDPVGETKKQAPSDDPSSIGNIFVALGKITVDQLSAALEKQASISDALLGAVLYEFGLVTTEDIAKVIKIQKKMRNGETLSAELDILEMKQAEVRVACQEVADTIERRKQILREKNERSDIFLLPMVAAGRN